MNFRYILTVLTTSIIFFLPGFTFAQGSWTWAKSFGSKGYDYARDIVAAPSGNIYSTGYCNDTTDFNPDPSATYFLDSYYGDFLYILKLNTDGEFIRAIAIADTNSVKGEVITLDPEENIIVGGTFSQSVDFDPDTFGVYELNTYSQQSIFISKYDSAGAFKWARKFSGPNSKFINSVATDSYGNVYTTGIFYDSLDFNPDPLIDSILIPQGYSTAFFFKLDSAGNFCWAHMLDSDHAYGWDIRVDQNDDIILLGESSDTIDLDPDPTGTDIFLPYLFGETFFAKYTSQGDYLWGRQFVSYDVDQVYDITTDAENNILISGDFAGILEVMPGNDTLLIGQTNVLWGGYMTKFSPSGAHIWSRQFPSNSDFVPYGIQTDMQGNIFSTGFFKDSADFNPDTLVSNWLYSGFFGGTYLSVLDSSGNFVACLIANGEGDEIPEKLTVDQFGSVYVTGIYNNDTLIFGSDTIFKNENPSSSTFDIFIAKAGNFITGLEESVSTSTTDFTLYPNPATDYFKVHTTSFPSIVSVSDITGKCIFSTLITDSTPFDVHNLSPGIYLVTLTGNHFSETQKLVVTAD